jgi:hypothetical protein
MEARISESEITCNILIETTDYHRNDISYYTCDGNFHQCQTPQPSHGGRTSSACSFHSDRDGLWRWALSPMQCWHLQCMELYFHDTWCLLAPTCMGVQEQGAKDNILPKRGEATGHICGGGIINCGLRQLLFRWSKVRKCVETSGSKPSKKETAWKDLGIYGNIMLNGS